MSGQQSQLDLDVILSVLENPIRRRILRKLAQENNYPLQLSKELNVSQQAVMKHLKVLEESDFVVSFEVPSNKGGPPRRVFTPRKRYCIRIDIGPNTYSEEIESYRHYEVRRDEPETARAGDELKLEISGKVTGEMRSEIAGALPAFIDPKIESLRLQLDRVIKEHDRGTKFAALSDLIRALEKEVSQIEGRRKRIMTIRERANEEANLLINGLTDDPLDKEVLMHLLKNNDIDSIEGPLKDGSENRNIESMIRTVKRKHSLS